MATNSSKPAASGNAIYSAIMRVLGVICPCGTRRTKYTINMQSATVEMQGTSPNFESYRKIQEPGDQAGDNPITMVAQKEIGDEDLNDDVEAEDIELPPPMEIQDHMFKAQETSADDIAKMASTLSLKAIPDSEISEIEQLVKQRMDPNNSGSLDHQGSSESGGENANECDPGQEVTEEDKHKYLQKRQYVVQELINTERDYVKDLTSIVEGYMMYMRDNQLPEDMVGKDKIVFGNIHQILDFHQRIFQPSLERCVDDPVQIGTIFVTNKRKLEMYVKYCENKPRSDYIVAEYLDEYFEELRQKLGHRLQLPDLLIKPVQRITKYKLLLNDILKYTDRAGEDLGQLRSALEVMKVVPKLANDMMQVGRLQGFNGNINAQGTLLLQDTLSVAELSGTKEPKFNRRRCFLFEQSIIFSEMIERKKGTISNPNYVFKNYLNVNKMAMQERVEGENSELRFILLDKTPGSAVRFLLQAASEEVRETWVKNINSILDLQRRLMEALVSPIDYYKKEQRELVKEMSTPELQYMPKEASLRKSQSQSAKNGHQRAQTPPESRLLHSDSQKYSRTKSVPSTSRPGMRSLDGVLDSNQDKNSLNSGVGGAGGGSAELSPRPKKNLFDGFKNSLKKSKVDASGCESGQGETLAAGAVSMTTDSTKGAGSRLNSDKSCDYNSSETSTVSEGLRSGAS